MEDRRREAIKTVAATAATLNSQILESMRDDYYAARIARRWMFDDAELRIAERVAESYPVGTHISEVGSGYGQLAMLLDRLGMDVSGTEPHRLRATMFSYLERNIGFGGNVFLTQYPIMVQGVRCGGEDVVVGSNLVNSWWQTWMPSRPEPERIREFIGDADAIFDLRCWWVLRETEEERRAVADDFEKAGYKASPITGSTVWHFIKQ